MPAMARGYTDSVWSGLRLLGTVVLPTRWRSWLSLLATDVGLKKIMHSTTDHDYPRRPFGSSERPSRTSTSPIPGGHRPCRDNSNRGRESSGKRQGPEETLCDKVTEGASIY